MSRSLDTLNKAVTDVIKDTAGKQFSKDALIEVIDDQIGFLRNAANFFNQLGLDAGNKLKEYLFENRSKSKALSFSLYNEINGVLCTAAQRANNERFLGAFHDTLLGLIVILDEINANIDLLFADKAIAVYNTKISQVAIFGMINNAKIASEFVTDYIALFMSDRNSGLYAPVPATIKKLRENASEFAAIINRVIGGKLSKSFVAAIKKYRNGGSDTNIVSSNNTSNAKFARLNTEVTEADMLAGAKGLKIFKIIGDFFVDRADTKIRKLRAEREVLSARAQLLQLELSGIDPQSPEYKRQVEIIKNYQKLIDRLNQKLDKLEND